MLLPIDITADQHIHTCLCNHASGEMEEYVEFAVSRGLRQITFLEHLEVDIQCDQRTWLRTKDFHRYFRRGKQLAEEYKNRIEIKLGIEVGLNPQAMDTITKQLAKYPWETLGLSYHYFSWNGRHYNMVSRRKENLRPLGQAGVERVVSGYFSGLILGVQHLPCSMVCHLDAVLRHLPDRFFSETHWEMIERLLALIQSKKLSLEINTSGFALREEPYPCKRIIHRAMELEIPLVAGSDAHRPDQVGRYFDRLPQWLQ